MKRIVNYRTQLITSRICLAYIIQMYMPKTIVSGVDEKSGIVVDIRKRYELRNGWGASVIKTLYHHNDAPPYGTYGATNNLWELAVLKNDTICYPEGLTDDVVGYLTNDEVENWLTRMDEYAQRVGDVEPYRTIQ